MVFGIVRFGFVEQEAQFETLLAINNVGKLLSGLGLILLSTAFIIYARNILKSHYETA